jgi:hypothetical protein
VLGGVLVFAACVALHGYVRRAPLHLLLRLIFAALAIAMIYPDVRVQVACVVVSGLIFAVLHRAARAKEQGLKAA